MSHSAKTTNAEVTDTATKSNIGLFLFLPPAFEPKSEIEILEHINVANMGWLN